VTRSRSRPCAAGRLRSPTWFADLGDLVGSEDHQRLLAGGSGLFGPRDRRRHDSTKRIRARFPRKTGTYNHPFRWSLAMHCALTKRRGQAPSRRGSSIHGWAGSTASWQRRRPSRRSGQSKPAARRRTTVRRSTHRTARRWRILWRIPAPAPAPGETEDLSDRVVRSRTGLPALHVLRSGSPVRLLGGIGWSL
jgi:hypothetical protein